MKKLLILCCLLFINTTYAQLIAIDDVVVGRSDNPGPANAAGPRMWANDYFNGTALINTTYGDFTLTETIPDPLGFITFNPLGFVSIAANTPQGIYYITYQICENAVPSNCDTAQIEIRVFPATYSAGTGSSQISLNTSSGSISCGANVCITDAFCVDLDTGTIPTLTLTADYTEVGTSDSYDVRSIPVNPPFSFGDTAADTPLTTDDNWSSVLNFAFDFEFYEQNYSSCVLSTNGAVSFDTSNAGAGHYWTPAAGALIPNNTDAALRNGNIFGAIHDMYPRTTTGTDPITAGSYRTTYSIKGEAPFRAFVFTFFNVGQYSCWGATRSTQMIIFYETTNIIENYLFQKDICAAWAGGRAAVGIQNNAGTEGISPPGRNTGVWNVATPEAWQFYPNGTANTVTSFQWLDESGAVIGTDPTGLDVNPSQTTTYVAQVTYTDALTSDVILAYKPITVVVSPTPVITVTSSPDTCPGGDAVFTISGSENDVIEYNLNGGTTQTITLDATEEFVITITGITTSQTLNLLSSDNLNSICGGPLTTSATVNIVAAPVVTLTSNSPICSGDDAVFTLTGSAGDVVDYTGVTGTPASPVTLDASGVGTVTVAGATTDQTITLTNINNPSATCGGPVSTSETVTINASPTSIGLTSNVSTCSGGNAEFTISGTAGDVVSYTGIAGSPASPVTLDASGVALVTVAGVTTDQTITLTNVTNPSTTCSGTLTNTETVTINANPSITLASNSSACSGEDAVFTITGTAGDIVDYTGVTGTPVSPVTLDASGLATVTVAGVSTNQTITLTNVSNPTTGCGGALSEVETVTINANPTITSLTTNTDICSGNDAVFTITGTAGDVVDYTGVTGTPVSPVTLDASGEAVITVTGATVDQTITLSTVTNTTTTCSSALSDTATITVNANPTITSLTSNVSTCSGGNATFTINGTAGDVVAYTGITGTPASPVTIDASGVALVTVTGVTTNQTITLGSVTNATTTCSSPLTDTATVTINANPTIVLTSNGSACSGDDAVFTITGTAGDVVDYTGVIGTPISPVTLDASGVATVTVAGVTTDQTITLTNVSNPSTGCSGALSEMDTVTINANPTIISLTTNTDVCSGSDAIFTITGTAGDVVDYTGVTGAPGSPVTLDASGIATVTVTGVTTNQTMVLSTVTNPVTTCSSALTDTATITIIASPTIVSLTSNMNICSGEDAVFTITGTAGDVVDYTGVSGTPASPVTLDASGISTITVAGVTTNQTISLTTVTNTTTTCSGTLSDTETVTIIAAPTVTLVSNGSTCSGGDAVFTISGTAGDIVDYSGITGLPASPVTLDASGTAMITVTGVTTDQTITLDTVNNPTTTCSSALSDTNTVTVNANPTIVSLTTNTDVCSGSDAVFTITGTAGDVVDYTGVTGTPVSPVTLNASGEATVTVTAATTDQTIFLSTVTTPATTCSSTLTDTATITINPNPVILSLTSNTSVCSGDDAIFTITGTAGDIVDYSGVTGVPGSPVTLDASGLATITVSGVTANQTITLDLVTNTTTTCSSVLLDTETVSIIAPPTVVLTSDGSACSGEDVLFTITGTAGDIIDYSGVTGIPVSPVTLDASGVAIVTVTSATVDQTIVLTNASSPSTGCSGTLSETNTVIINPNPTIISLTSNFSTCSGTDAEFTITGTAGDVVYYSGIVGVPASPVTLNASGVATVTVSGATATQTIQLTSVTTPTTTCSSVLSDSETVMIIPLEDASFSMTPNCFGGTANVTGTSGGVFIFDIDPADGSIIDSATGEVTDAIPGATYSILYTTGGTCRDSQVETFTVNPRPIVDLQDSFILCFDNDGNIVNDPTIDTGLSTLDYSFEWTEASNPTTVLGTNSFYEPVAAGTYSVFITNNSTGCVTVMGDPNTMSVVTNSIPPTGLEAVIVSETFASENVIQASVDDIPGASYEFSIDNGPFVSNGTNIYTFNNVTAGNHTITVRDADGCGDDSTTILVVDYPLFFTPNNDGHNDTWRISGINPDAVIHIFDRYGKLIKQLSPTSIGWDGTFNGQPLPSSDYWFSLEYRDPNNLEDTSVKEFRAHFTLKR
ncbi:T9SS type B sorting domain-containing protein [Lacinutrix sp. MEBiC02595]